MNNIRKFISNNIIVIEGIISFILLELLIYTFDITNNVCYLVISSAILTFMIEYVRKNANFKSRINKIVNIIFSIIFSATILVQTKINYNGKISQKFDENAFSKFELIDILKYILIFMMVFLLVLLIETLVENIRKKELILDNKADNKPNKKSKWTSWLIYTGIIAAFYIIFLLIYYPGSVLADSFSSIYQILGIRQLDNHFPIMYTFFVGIFIKIGSAINDLNIGIFLYSLTQIIIISSGLGYFLVWLKEKKVKAIYRLLTLIYFIGNSVFATYAIIMWKDPLFCLFLFLLMLKLYDVIDTKGEILSKTSTIIQFIILDILISFFRNNGIYIITVIVLILTIMYWKKFKKFILSNIIVVCIILVIQGPIYKALNITTPIQESLAIPIQQIAYTISSGGDIDQQDREFLYKILPEEDWKESYELYLVDSIKWNSNFQSEFLSENKIEFMKIWLKTLFKNPSSYIKSYLFTTYGFWSIETKSSYGFLDNYISENDYGIYKTNVLENITGINLENINSNSDYLGSGTLIWLLIFSMIILIINKEKKYILCFLPGILLWGTIMIATPVAFSLRYVFTLAYALPFTVIISLINKNKEEN